MNTLILITNGITPYRMRSNVCIVGLGYVGLPLAIEFDKAGFDVIGFDTDIDKISTLSSGTDPTSEVGDRAVGDSNIEFTSAGNKLSRADYILVTVPTPIDDLKNPNLAHVESAAKTIGRNIQQGAIVVLESTVYPGATREILTPAIENESGLSAGEDFYVGYSPERMVPGDSDHGLRNVVKIISGQNESVRNELADLYGSIVDAGIYDAGEIEVAEAAKAFENIQRDVNIALVNELAIACNNLGIDSHEVLDAAGTKWNFHEYRPGFVGGHCIPVDPFFMIYESERNGFSPKLIEQGREVNDFVPIYVADLTLRGLNDCGKVLRESTILVLGLSYKPGVGDIRTSIVGATIDRLNGYGVTILGADPYADESSAQKEFDISIQTNPSFDGVDGVILATPHEQYIELDYVESSSQMNSPPLVVDVEGVLNQDQLSSAGVEYIKI